MYHVLLTLQIASVIITVICVLILGYERSRIQQKLLMITIICAFCYCLGYTVELVSTTYQQAVSGLKIEYVGASYLVICYITFLLKYFKKQHNRFIFGYFFFIDVLTMIAVLRMEVCDWYYMNMGFSYDGLFPHMVFERGPLYYIFFANNVVMIIYGFAMVIQELIHQKDKQNSQKSNIKKRTLIVLLITTCIPFVPYFMGSMGVLKYFDFVPMGFLAAALILMVIVLRDNIFDVVTGAHEQMLAAMDDAVIIVNNQMEFLEANKAAVDIFPSLFNFQVEKKCPDEVIKIFDKIDEEITINLKGRCYERHSSKVYKESSLIGYSVLLIDVTESNELMNQLREMKNQADQANKAKSTFLANVSHELRTPLNAVLGYSDLIIQETDNKEEQNHAYAIRKAADNLLSIINTILDISKIESGKIDIIKGEYDTMELFTEVVNIVAIPAKNKGLKLNVDIDSNIPAVLYGDKDHIRQVLINLLNNAIKFTVEGEVILSVTGKQGGTGFIEIVYEIRDTGIGIRPEDMEKIFEQFEQADNKSIGKVEGTGLGLFISRSLIGLMGGTMSAESEYGKGSVFTIHLTQRVCSEDTISGMPLLIRNQEQVKSKVNLYAPKAKILSVDDNMVNNGVFYEFCKQFGIEAMLADNGYKAVEILKKESFDILFLDQMMPGMDGVETLKEIKRIPNLNPDMSILAFTANAIRGNSEYLISQGFDDVVTKPIGIRELEVIIDYYLPKEKKENRILSSTEDRIQRFEERANEKVEEEVSAALENDELKNLIQTEVGLGHCNHDKDLYRQTLSMLLSYVPEKLNLLKEYQSEKKYESYIIEVHALKNNAALIGAMSIAEEAKSLEFAGKEGRYDEIDEKTDVFLKHYELLLALIEKGIDSGVWL